MEPTLSKEQQRTLKRTLSPIDKDLSIRVRSAQERIEAILETIRLPLAEALEVSEEELPNKSKDILQEIAELNEQMKKADIQWEAAVNDAVSTLPDDLREEGRAYIAVILHMFGAVNEMAGGGEDEDDEK